MSLKLKTIDGINLYFDQSMFPVGENYVKLKKESFGYIGEDQEINIEWIFSGDSEIIQLFLLVDSIRRINKNIKINLTIPYFPGARQDRVCEPGEGFGLKVYADLINSLNLNKVTVFDPHSDVTGALVNNIKIIDNRHLVYQVLEKEFGHLFKVGIPCEQLITLISPDAGSNKKIFKLAPKLLFKNIEAIRADKIRDTKTGEITGTEVYGNVSEKTVFIIDDICSRGGTFMALAKKLKEDKEDLSNNDDELIPGAARIILIVSHYEGTADINKLKNSGIDKVYCYNDFGRTNDEFIVKIN